MGWNRGNDHRSDSNPRLWGRLPSYSTLQTVANCTTTYCFSWLDHLTVLEMFCWIYHDTNAECTICSALWKKTIIRSLIWAFYCCLCCVLKCADTMSIALWIYITVGTLQMLRPIQEFGFICLYSYKAAISASVSGIDVNWIGFDLLMQLPWWLSAPNRFSTVQMWVKTLWPLGIDRQGGLTRSSDILKPFPSLPLTATVCLHSVSSGWLCRGHTYLRCLMPKMAADYGPGEGRVCSAVSHSPGLSMWIITYVRSPLSNGPWIKWLFWVGGGRGPSSWT